MADQPHAALLNSELKFSLEENIRAFETILNVPQNKDAVLRRYRGPGFEICAIYLEGMASEQIISEFILRASKTPRPEGGVCAEARASWLADCAVEIGQCTQENRVRALVSGILGGMTAVLVEDSSDALLLETRGFEHRKIGKPSNESVVIGAQEGFVESIRDNLTLMHRYIQSGELIVERMTVGSGVPTGVALLYLKDVCKESVVREARSRLKRIDAPSVQGVGGIQQLIEDSPGALFPQMLQTERPDRAASCLLEGQFVILAENSPYALTAPITLFHLLHTSDDTFMRWQNASFLRFVRILGALISLLLPGLYVALTLHHAHLVPLPLLLSIAETRADVPFSILGEVLMMELAFYLINEAGTRIPSQIGSTVSIVGALILGQAAVSASIISPILVIVVALTGLGAYAVPNYGMSVSIVLYRFAVILASAALGLYGLMLTLMALTVHLCSLRSFGVPYLAPIAPKRPHNPDILLRLPLSWQRTPMYYAKPGSWLFRKGA